MNMMEAHRQKRALQEWFPAPSFPEQQTPPEQGEVLLPAVLLHQEAAALPAVLPVLFHRRDREEETVQQVIQIMDLVWQEAALPAAVLLVRAALPPGSNDVSTQGTGKQFRFGKQYRKQYRRWKCKSGSASCVYYTKGA